MRFTVVAIRFPLEDQLHKYYNFFPAYTFNPMLLIIYGLFEIAAHGFRRSCTDVQYMIRNFLQFFQSAVHYRRLSITYK